ncbi:hypothetical protein [Actinomyces bowdenii]|uniref:hypothetical protein n=1 Tax=Actinomyces bowdenii TaxID=131109 RepID=UPI00163AD1E8|nr:hypothetical protein [Actinomyces bowdenii]
MCTAIGAGALVNWWFEMFSDSPYADLCRSMMDSTFDLGRNTIALIEPAIGGMMFFGGLFLLAETDSPLGKATGWLCLSFMALAMLGLIPFPLPKPMYPEWQMEKRRQRRAQAHREELATNQNDTPTPSPHHPKLTAQTGPDDSLPPRAHHRESSPPRP